MTILAAIWNFIYNTHPAFSLWLFVAAVGALPTPTEKNGTFYQWFFNFATVVAAGLGRFIATNLPKTNLGKLMIKGPGND